MATTKAEGKLAVWKSKYINYQYTVNNWTKPGIGEILIMLEHLNSMNDKLSELQEAYYVETKGVPDPMSDMATYDQAVFNTLAKCAELKKEYEDAHSLKMKQTPFKLEKIPTPEFNGKFNEWNSFYDLFVSAVVNNKTLSDTERMVYLKSSLTGEAAPIVSTFSTSSSSFASLVFSAKSVSERKRNSFRTLQKV